mmetsp:Transcript_57070/g.165574  ORF Transcript_57070/g.165574 Transcript_57070/m.165574 type:complete len:337 (+) Transcript_57070:1329-2339(+)
MPGLRHRAAREGGAGDLRRLRCGPVGGRAPTRAHGALAALLAHVARPDAQAEVGPRGTRVPLSGWRPRERGLDGQPRCVEGALLRGGPSAGREGGDRRRRLDGGVPRHLQLPRAHSRRLPQRRGRLLRLHGLLRDRVLPDGQRLALRHLDAPVVAHRRPDPRGRGAGLAGVAVEAGALRGAGLRRRRPGRAPAAALRRGHRVPGQPRRARADSPALRARERRHARAGSGRPHGHHPLVHRAERVLLQRAQRHAGAIAQELVPQGSEGLAHAGRALPAARLQAERRHHEGRLAARAQDLGLGPLPRGAGGGLQELRHRSPRRVDGLPSVPPSDAWLY